MFHLLHHPSLAALPGRPHRDVVPALGGIFAHQLGTRPLNQRRARHILIAADTSTPQEEREQARKTAEDLLAIQLDDRSLESLISLLSMFGLPAEIPSSIDVRELEAAMKQDKKVRQGKIMLPVLVGLGRAQMKTIDSSFKLL